MNERFIFCDQNTPEWHSHRCGRVTGSRVADLLRKGQNGQPSKMRATYYGDIVAERLAGVQESSGFVSGPMQWGKDNEEAARALYAFMNDVEPVKVGFIIHPRFERAGASPDSIINHDGGLETKCPNSATHIASLLGARVDPDYYKQCQWNMACAEREWWDLCSYDPRFPAEMQLDTKRIYRDEATIRDLEAAVAIFLDEVAAAVEKLRRRFIEGRSELHEQLRASVG